MAETPQEEVNLKVGTQWFYRGNRSPRWLACASRLDGSMSGIAEQVPPEMWAVLESLAECQGQLAVARQIIHEQRQRIVAAELGDSHD